MRCTKCGTESTTGRKFCAGCGNLLSNRCPKCGADNAPASAFCEDCGAALSGGATPAAPRSPRTASAAPEISVAPDQPDASPALEGERKTVTALFADIKGSTELMEDLDPEEARAIIDPALKLMIDAVHRYDGYIVQSTGDGVFALFGAPVAHEDHPQRALYAALRMQEDLRRYSDRLREGGKLPLQARVGVNTGEAVVRSIATGEGRPEYTPIGHSTSLASRMQTLAPVGSIAISGAVRKLVEGYFTLKALGPARIKGVSEPVEVYEVTGLGPLRTRLQRSAVRGYTKFVGRHREIDAMKHAAEQAKAGHGQIVAAIGEPGVGKSRLLLEFKAISQSGWMVLEAFSISHGKASAFLPVIELLHAYFDIKSEDDSRKRREKVNGKILTLDRSLEDTLPHLFALLGIVEGGDPLAGMDAQIKRRRTLDAIKRILLRETLSQPLIVIFEDLHWIDGETQTLLNLLADSIATAKILLLVNYRPEYHHEWGSKTYYTQLRLDPLGKESADEMLSAMLGDGIELAPVKRLIIGKTEGNPFFMEETVQVMFDEGVLARNGTVKLTKSLSQLKIPPTVQAILASRIDRLPPDEKDLLQTLAVIGQEFPFGLVKSVVAKSEDELNRMLSDLQLGEFIYEQPASGDVEYIFKHALTQDVAANSMLIEKRRLLHEQAARAIESLFADRLDDHIDQLAHHYGQSGDLRKAVHYLLKAGIDALQRSGYTHAMEHLSTGLDLIKSVPDSADKTNQELELQLSLAAVLQALKGQAALETGKVLERAYELCVQMDKTDSLTIVLGQLKNYYNFRGHARRAHELAIRAHELSEQIGNPALIAMTHFNLSHADFYVGEFAPSLEHAEKMRVLTEPVREPWARIGQRQSAWQSSRALWFLGFHNQAIARGHEAINKLRRNFDPFGLAIAAGVLAEIHAYGDEYGLIKEPLEEHIALNAEYGLAAVIPGRRKILEGWCVVQSRDLSNGTAMIREGIELNSLASISLNSAFYFSLLTRAYALAGRTNEGLHELELALAQIESSGERFYEAEILRLKGELLQSSSSDLRHIEETFLGAIEVARRQSAKRLELRATTSLARLLDRQGKRDDARAMLAEIYNWFTEGFDTADLKDAKALLDELRP